MRKERLLLLPLLAACAASPAVAPQPPASQPSASREIAAESVHALAALHERYRVEGLDARRFSHAELWSVVGPHLDRSSALHREEIGRSAEGRPLYAVGYGSGPVPVLLWSQMHGDESTATMALADLLHFFGSTGDDARARRIAERLTVWMIPMLNPDGAERFQRRNAQGIDINRDARALATPEGRALRAVQQRLRPVFGFNLHDQDVRTSVAGTDRIAAIALLAPPFDEARSDDPVRLRAARLAAVMRHAAEPLVGGHIARYDDSYNPRAFGDGMQSWGTSTVLVESGGWRDDPEKQFLRRVNFVMLLAALDAIATGSYEGFDPSGYRGLPFNGPPISDLLVRGGTVVAHGTEPFRADLMIGFADPLHRTDGRIADVGDLAWSRARDTLDATGLFLHLEPEVGVPAVLRAPATLVARTGAHPGSRAVWSMERGHLRTASAQDEPVSPTD